MFVCHCKVVSDETVRGAIRDGASTVQEIGERCGAGTECFGCHALLRRLLAEQGIDDSAVAGSL